MTTLVLTIGWLLHLFLTSSDNNHFWDLIASISGGVIGALAGGVPAYLIANRSSREAARKDRDTKVNIDLSLLYSTFIKIMEITNGCYTICAQINGMLYKAHVDGRKDMELWQKVQSIVNVAEEPVVRFDPQEIALFMRPQGDPDFANALLLLDKRYASLLTSVRAYSVRREALDDQLPTTELKDGVGSITLTKEEAAKVIPKAYALNSLLTAILEVMHEERRTSTRLSNEFHAIAKRLFPGRPVPGFAPVT